MKKLAVIFVVVLMFVGIGVVMAHSVRYTEYTYKGEKKEMKSSDFHFKNHLYGKPGYKITGIHYSLEF